jgi:hypothetical protein
MSHGNAGGVYGNFVVESSPLAKITGRSKETSIPSYQDTLIIRRQKLYKYGKELNLIKNCILLTLEYIVYLFS